MASRFARNMSTRKHVTPQTNSLTTHSKSRHFFKRDGHLVKADMKSCGGETARKKERKKNTTQTQRRDANALLRHTLTETTSHTRTQKPLCGSARAVPGPRVGGGGGKAKNLAVQLHHLGSLSKQIQHVDKHHIEFSCRLCVDNANRMIQQESSTKHQYRT